MAARKSSLWMLMSGATQTGRWHPLPSFFQHCPCVDATYMCVCVCLTEKGFVYGDEERRYSHIRRRLATAMHRLARTSVTAAVAKFVLYSKHTSGNGSRPAVLLCWSGIRSTGVPMKCSTRDPDRPVTDSFTRTGRPCWALSLRLRYVNWGVWFVARWSSAHYFISCWSCRRWRSRMKRDPLIFFTLSVGHQCLLKNRVE